MARVKIKNGKKVESIVKIRNEKQSQKTIVPEYKMIEGSLKRRLLRYLIFSLKTI